MRGNTKHLVFSVCVAFVLCAFASVSSAKTIYVPDDYAKIRWSVDNASDGDTIIVRDGNYYENVVVSKKLTIKSENGSDNCIIDGGGSGDVITLYADGITIEGFTVRNSGSSWPTLLYAGIKVFSNANKIAYNSITNNCNGILSYSSNNTIANNNITNNRHGIYLDSSSNNIIANNNISSNNENGIFLWSSRIFPFPDSSSNNIIANNNITNNRHGIYLSYSNSNTIYLNNFIDNTYQVYSYYSTNIWNSTEKITYTYNGKQHTNYLGNYWSDYTGSDADRDGIGDTPYSINADRDNYPLIERFEHYFVPTPAQIFDTGRPENPYPSISGEFVGTIRTNTTIIATKLYTYACEGTGGHTEHVLICNSTWCAEAEWEGYKGDWMNISFNRTVVLMPHETYNITIVTGSYPQIHHTSSLKTENGWINCTEFTDANGKKYENWIPAIKLWS